MTTSLKQKESETLKDSQSEVLVCQESRGFFSTFERKPSLSDLGSRFESGLEIKRMIEQ